MSGPAYGGVIIEGLEQPDVPVLLGVAKKTWPDAELFLARLGHGTWVSPMFPDATDVENYERLSGTLPGADLARALKKPVWAYEYYSRSSYYARAERFDAGGSRVVDLSMSEDPEAFDTMADRISSALGWPAEMFHDGIGRGQRCPTRLPELGVAWTQAFDHPPQPIPRPRAPGAFVPDPAGVGDADKFEVRFELPTELLETIEAEAIERDCSLSKIVQEHCARPAVAAYKSFGGPVRAQRFYLSGKLWKGLCAEATAQNTTPSQVLVGRAAGAPPKL